MPRMKSPSAKLSNREDTFDPKLQFQVDNLSCLLNETFRGAEPRRLAVRSTLRIGDRTARRRGSAPRSTSPPIHNTYPQRVRIEQQ